MPSYTTVERAYPYRLRGTQQQTNNGLLYTPPSLRIAQAGGTPQSSSTQLLVGLEVGYAALQNRSGGTIVVGLPAGRLPNRFWRAGQWTNATTTYTDDTADAQSTTAGDFPLEVVSTNNDGYVILSPYPFNAISLNVATASAGGAAVRAISYSDSTGAAWADYGSNYFILDGATGNYATGEQLVVIDVPADWGLSSSLATGIPDGFYALRVRATTAPTGTAGAATALEVWRVYLPIEGLADNSLSEAAPVHGLRMPHAEALGALFGTADMGNRATADVKVYG